MPKPSILRREVASQVLDPRKAAGVWMRSQLSFIVLSALKRLEASAP